AVAFIDRTAASSSAPGTVKVWSTSMCAASCAEPIAVAEGASSAALLLANDGKNVVVFVPKAGADPAQLVLVTFPGGQVTSLTSEPTAHAPMLSPDGATVAWVETPDQIVSAATASPADTTSITVTTGDSGTFTVPTALMAGAGQFVVGVKPTGQSDSSLFLVTASASTPLHITAPARASIVEQTPSDSSASTRYLF